MKQDVLDALSGRFPKKVPSKETLDLFINKTRTKNKIKQIIILSM